MHKRIAVLAVAAACAGAPVLAANEFEAPLTELARSDLAAWVAEPAIVAAVLAQNAAHAGLTQADIDGLDAAWRAEVGATPAPMIDGVLADPASVWLRERQEASAGLVTEVFVMDDRGLNVAQSEVTSDFWQGDEPKWQDTYKAGPEALDISEVELDESTQTYQSQVSMPVIDPATGAAIGAVTFGIDVSLLQ